MANRTAVEPAFLNQLAAVVGDTALLHERDELLVYECDGLTMEKHLPQAVVFPQSAPQVARVVKLCVDHGVPYVARGAGTGISGGANPIQGGVLIHLSRMCQILEVDVENRYAVVEPGVVNTDLSRAVAHHGLHFAPDPSSQKVSTIGGNVAENAGGPHCFKYGTTINHVLALELVTPDGDLIQLGGPEYGQPGYDLVALQVGSEGTLGVVTKIGVKLTPLPEGVATLLITFPSLATAAEAVTDIVSSSIVPSAIEMMDQGTLKVIESSPYRAGFPTDAAAILLLELDGFKPGVAADTVTVTKLCEKHGALSVEVGEDPEQREKLWAARKCTYGILGRVNTDLYVLDGCVPRSVLPRALDGVQEIGKKYDLEFTSVFHAGDGNLHPLVAFDGRDEAEVKKVLDAGEEIMKLCLDLGGTLSGEHGIGLEKKRFMPLLFSSDDLSTMRGVKSTLDPEELCNPGKIFPDAPTNGTGAAGGNGSAPATRSLSSLPRELGSICGEDALDGDLEAHAIDGVVPSAVVTPRDEAAVAEVLRYARTHGYSVSPRGGGTHMMVGNVPRSLDIVLNMTGLDQVVRYEPADQVIVAQGGCGLDKLKQTVLDHLHWMPLSPPSPQGSTVGGMIATDLSTPARGNVGSLRDLVLGARIALPDGRIVKSGGAVIKNVSGYDLHRLMCGALGTLGVVLEASLRVHSLPPAIRSLLVSFPTMEGAIDFSHKVRAAGMAPLAQEIGNEAARNRLGIRLSEDLAGGEFAVSLRFGETEQAVSWQVLQATNIANENGCAGVKVVEGPGEVQLWERFIRFLGKEGEARLRIGARPGTVGGLIPELLSVAPDDTAVNVRYGGGELIFEFAETDEDETLSRIRALAEKAADRAATVIVERVSTGVKKHLDCWATPIAQTGLMRRIKNSFDPTHTLNPGRFAGRI